MGLESVSSMKFFFWEGGLFIVSDTLHFVILVPGAVIKYASQDPFVMESWYRTVAGRGCRLIFLQVL